MESFVTIRRRFYQILQLFSFEEIAITLFQMIVLNLKKTIRISRWKKIKWKTNFDCLQSVPIVRLPIGKKSISVTKHRSISRTFRLSLFLFNILMFHFCLQTSNASILSPINTVTGPPPSISSSFTLSVPSTSVSSYSGNLLAIFYFVCFVSDLEIPVLMECKPSISNLSITKIQIQVFVQTHQRQ